MAGNNPFKASIKIFFFIPLFFVILSCGSNAPVIASINPKIGRMGEVITLTGSGFGESQEDSYVTIAGISPTGSSYFLWQDDRIMVRVPEFGDSGLVYVHVRGEKSNGVLFSNAATVPRPIEGEEFGLRPLITSIAPAAGATGAMITITGNNFGVSHESALESLFSDTGVFFSWDYTAASFNPFAVREPEFIEVSETELGYISWNTREIVVLVPDGAVSGNIEIRTPHGTSRPAYFEVSGKPGAKIFSEKRTFTVNYSVDIRVLEATRPNNLYLWVPMPVISPSQRNVNIVSRTAEPFIENFRGVSLYKLENLSAGTNQVLNFSFSVDVYSVETDIRHENIRQEASPLFLMYTQSSSLLPADDSQIRSAVNGIVGREQNPYLKAGLLYNWIIGNIDISETYFSHTGNIALALEKKSADSYTASLLYTTMLRAAGIPCVPAAGVLADRSGRTLRHYWTEFWIDNFGWVPADVVMGAGAVPESFIFKENPQEYYFGNLDSQRIAFSRGEVFLSQMESRGRLVSYSRYYSLQNIWEEASGGLESYNSFWGDIAITGIYAQ